MLYDFRSGASTITDHVRAIEDLKAIKVFSINMLGNCPVDISSFPADIIIIHYSLVMCMDAYINQATKDAIKNFKGLKACFIQDEYRFIDNTVKAMQYLGVDVIFTCVPESEFDKVYPLKKMPKLHRVNVLTGYVPSYLRKINNHPPYESRAIDVMYRARPIPYELGELGQEKYRIAINFQKDTRKTGIVTDISVLEEERIYGADWLQFLMSSKACLGTESGASVFDFSGKLQAKVESYRKKKPEASFEEIQNLFFKDLEGKIKLNQISPRVFEAASCKTLMILYEGEYSGILRPWRHYIPLKKDHSNIDVVVWAMKCEYIAHTIVESAYQEVAMNPEYSYEKLSTVIEETLLSEFKSRGLKIVPKSLLGNLSAYYLINVKHGIFSRFNGGFFDILKNARSKIFLNLRVFSISWGLRSLKNKIRWLLVRLKIALYQLVFSRFLFFMSSHNKMRIKRLLRQFYDKFKVFR